MRNALSRSGLKAVEALRLQAGIVFGRPVSRASLARAANLNDATLQRGLTSVPPRLRTVAEAAGGMLVVVTELAGREPRSMSSSPFKKQIEEAAQRLAFAIGDVPKLDPAAARKSTRIKEERQALDRALKDTVASHYPREQALRFLTLAWLDGDGSHGVKLALYGLATAIALSRPLSAEAAGA